MSQESSLLCAYHVLDIFLAAAKNISNEQVFLRLLFLKYSLGENTHLQEEPNLSLALSIGKWRYRTYIQIDLIRPFSQPKYEVGEMSIQFSSGFFQISLYCPMHEVFILTLNFRIQSQGLHLSPHSVITGKPTGKPFLIPYGYP